MRRLAGLLATVALALPACAEAASRPDAPTAVATVYPLSWLVAQVAPDATLTSVAQGGQGPHDVELSPGQRVAIEQADVVVFLGDIGFQPQVEDAVRASDAAVVAVNEVVGDNLLRAGGAHGHEHDDEDEHTAAVDPHVWFDPTLMAAVAEATGEAFAHVDAAGAAGYRERAAAVAEQLAALDAELDALLDDCAHDEAIVSHEAYGYLLEPRGLSQHGIAGLTPEAGASPQSLAELAAEIRAEGIAFVLAEPVEGRADAEALAGETGVELLEIQPLEAVTAEQAARGYPALLREQAQRFATALECRP